MAENEVLAQIRNSLLDIQTRLSRLEAQNDEKMILNESIIAERGLGGRRVYSSSKGGIKRNIHLPFCYVCGRRLGEEVVICEECGNPCSPECVVNFDGVTRCLKCLQRRFPKRAFKVLCCAPLSKRRIHKVTGIPKEDIDHALTELQKNGLIVKKGLIFRHFELTDTGREVLYLYSRVYKEEDILEIKEQVAKIKGEF
jgi:predicted transcriptional regulator